VLAAGLRLIPAEPDTTIGAIDVWAEPDTGLPVEVEVAGRSGGAALFDTRFLDLRRQAPQPAVLVPPRPPSAGFTVTTQPDLAAALNAAVPVRLPGTLAGRSRVLNAGGISGVGGYGSGLTMFVVLPLPGRLADRFLDSAHDAGGVPLTLAGHPGYQLGNAVFSTLVAGPEGGPAFVLAGFVTPDLLRRAGTELLTATGGGR
jgi:hypothetical protein